MLPSFSEPSHAIRPDKAVQASLQAEETLEMVLSRDSTCSIKEFVDEVFNQVMACGGTLYQ